MITYEYIKYVNPDKLWYEIIEQVGQSPLTINRKDDDLKLIFDPDLSLSDKDILDQVILHHDPDDTTLTKKINEIRSYDRYIFHDQNEYSKKSSSWSEVTSTTFTPKYSGNYKYELNCTYDGSDKMMNLDLYYAYPGNNYDNITECDNLYRGGSFYYKTFLPLEAGVEYFFSLEYKGIVSYRRVYIREITIELVLYQGEI